jgi:hypothetical protein
MAISFKGAHFPQDIMLMGIRWYLAYPFGQKTPMRHFRGVYGPTTVRSLPCNLPPYGPYSPPVRDNHWGGMIHGLEATTGIDHAPRR